jgi:hypothetical protein
MSKKTVEVPLKASLTTHEIMLVYGSIGLALNEFNLNRKKTEASLKPEKVKEVIRHLLNALDTIEDRSLQ